MSRLPQTKRLNHTFIKGNDPTELSTYLSSSMSKLTVKPLSARGVMYECTFANLGSLGVGLFRYEGEVLVEREGECDRVLIFLPRYGKSVTNASGRDVVTMPGRGAIFDGNRHTKTLLLERRKHLVLSIDRAALRNRLTCMLERPVAGDLDFVPEIDFTSGLGMAISHIAATLQTGLAESASLRSAPLALASLSDALTQLVLESLPHRFSPQLQGATSPAPRHVKRAIEFIRSNLSLTLNVDEIAAVCGVSTRTLHNGFRQFKMTTPMAYVQYLRLEAVHEELLQALPGQTVSEIALRWGFGHMGRFASDYRARFGLLPSETLRSAAAA